MARVGVITFPGSLDDRDAVRAVRIAGAEPVTLWHADHDLQGVDAVVLPGGFSYGDYLRCGAIAKFAPLMAELVPAANAGLPVLGICNGFQILCEAHLLPGALTRNGSLHFICRDQRIRIDNASTLWTAEYKEGQELVVPLKSRFGIDDSLDVGGVHLVGGIIGSLALGLFATKTVNPAGADGLFYGGGYRQLVLQAVAVAAVVAYSFTVTSFIGVMLDYLPARRNRVTPQDESVGLDFALHGESAYQAERITPG